MKILIVSQYFYPENFRINDLAADLVQQGHNVTVLTGIPNYPAGHFFAGYGWFRNTEELWQGVRIVRAPLVARGKGGGLRLALNYFSFALFASLRGWWKLGRDFDAIFVHEVSPITVGIPAITMKKLSGAPILFWVLDLWPESVTAAGSVRQPWILALLARLTRWIYGHCDRVLVQSRGFIRHTLDMGVPQQHIRYFPSWAEDLYQPHAAADIAAPAWPQGFRLLFAGNIGAAQDFPSILAAAELLKGQAHIHWLIAGDGRILSWVREEVQRRGLQGTVHLLGRHPVEAMPGFFAHADALLVSLKREPIFASTIPGKIQSYMASGRPIVAMLDGEGARIVEEAQAGVSCPAEDPAALAAKVAELAGRSPGALELAGRNARRYYEEHFERRVLFSRLEEWMKELCNEDKRA